MTENELRAKLVATAKSYAGAQKGSAKHKEIIDTYNTISPLPRGYKLTYTDDWCAGFVSAMSKLCGFLDIIPAECAAHRLYQNMPTHKEHTYTPKAGDIILYDWNSNNWADHIGIVTECTAGAITVIEGNKGSPSQVGYRSIAVGSNLILGFGVPDYASLATEEETVNLANEPTKSADIAVDGVWGTATTKKAQIVFGCTVDGVRGKQTIKAIQKWCGAWQDGVLGKQTIKAMQKKLGVTVDGILGKQTIRAFQTWLNEQED